MAQDIEAARAKRGHEAGSRGPSNAVLLRAEASFRAPEAPAETEAARAERELRERTERLRAARLAQEEVKRRGVEIRAGRRRTP